MGLTAADDTLQKISEPEKWEFYNLKHRGVRVSVRNHTKQYESEEEQKSIWRKKIYEEIKVEMFQNEVRTLIS